MHGLKYKILLSSILPLLFILVLISGLTVYNKYNTEKQLLLQRLNSYQTLLESGDLSFDSSQDKKKLEALLNEKVEFTEILSRDSSVIYTTENSAAPMIETQEKNDVDEAFQGYEITKTNKRNGKSIFVIFSPLIVKGQVVAVLHQAVSNELSTQRVVQYALFVASLTFGGMVVCYVLISFLLNEVILKNIYNLKQAALQMQTGNLKAPIAVFSDDEIGEFAKIFETMRTQVNAGRMKLEEYNKQLEGLVNQRTVELETKVNELEKMNKLMVGRELKMTELKRELEEFQKRYTLPEEDSAH